MAGSFSAVPPASVAALRPVILAHWQSLAGQAGEQFSALFDPYLASVLRTCLRCAGADEGTVWLLDDKREFLVPRFNTGERAADFVDTFQQPLGSGMISMVVATEQPICENTVAATCRQDRSLDERLGLQTCAMLAVPYYFAGELRGVISAVQLRASGAEGESPPGFSREHLEILQRGTLVLSRLVDYRLLLATVDLEDRF